MTYHIFNEFSQSTLFPSKRSLDREDFDTLAEKAYLVMMALRILLCIEETRDWAKEYLKDTLQSGQFRQWRSTGTDLYIMLWALTEGEYDKDDRAPDHVPAAHFARWLRALKNNPTESTETKRLFLKLDSLFHIKDSSMKNVRRLVQDWDRISEFDQQIAMTRLLQMLRARARRAQILGQLSRAAKEHDLERRDADNPETVTETATVGATGASSVAAVVGALGVGFDQNGHQGIYDTGKKKRKSTGVLIKRPPIA